MRAQRDEVRVLVRCSLQNDPGNCVRGYDHLVANDHARIGNGIRQPGQVLASFLELGLQF